MIQVKENEILLSSDKTSLLFHINEIRKVTVEYYGRKILSLEEVPSLIRRYPYNQGCSVSYDTEHTNLSLDHMKLLCSTLGKGDFFAPSIIVSNSKSSVFDFVYDSYEIKDVCPLQILPFPHGGKEELIIHLKESHFDVFVDYHFIIFEEENIIATYVEIKNKMPEPLVVNKAASLQLPMVNHDYELYSTYGNWAGELTLQMQDIKSQRVVLESLRGSSSNRHNPFFLIKEKQATYQHGDIYGFNLMYSSNFENSIEMDSFGDIRVQVGISSILFKKELKEGEKFITPIALMSYSHEGINSLSSQFHDFINNHIIPSRFNQMDRPVAYNNWEATGAKFNKGKIVSLMKQASKLGVELFVLDDGWFSSRDDDSHGLGDWETNTKKLPGGLKALSEEAKKLNLQFGIWMEPEMINQDTKTYKEHPDWVIKDEYHKPSPGRNQYVLDLRNKEVQDFIVESVTKVLESGDISYLKWDYNRDISDFDNRDGTFFYDYMIGLYSALDRIIKKFPNVLFENCASGGNRFDLGMLSYFAQSWMSDDTDSYQRTLIQEGGLLGYPLSVMSNHVAAKTSNQMLRFTSYDTKYNTACFGVLGYELDLDDLSKQDRDIISKQIAFYKEHRHTFQWGRVYQDQTYVDHDSKMIQASNADEVLVSLFSKIQKPNPTERHLRCFALDENKLYTYETRQESIPLKMFGNLVNYVAPIHINPEGLMMAMLSKHIDMKTEVDKGVISGGALMSQGAVLAQEWSGVGYDERVRKMGDFGSRLYLIKEKEEAN